MLLIDFEGFPYGIKDLFWLKNRLINLVDNSGNKEIIIACNTLSSIIYYFNLKFSKKVVDVVTPTILFFNEKKYEKIIILATKNTIKMDVYSKYITADITYIDASTLIEAIQKNQPSNKIIDGLKSIILDTKTPILLGCTHLIKLKEIFRSTFLNEIISQDEIFIKNLL